MLRITNLGLQLGNKVLFNGINLVLNNKEKVGIVGANGAGKSSLLKVIVGQVKPDHGAVINDGKYAYLSQEVHIDKKFDENADITVEEYIEQQLGQTVQTWEISKLINLINLVGKTPESKISEMSGGQKIKVEIIKILLSKADLLILDEPTNFLDIPTAEWLMSYLVKYPSSVLVISHDLRLMNKAISKIWFLNEFTKKIEVFNGNYDDFLISKDTQDSVLAKKLKDQDKEYLRLKELAQKKNKMSGKGDIAARIVEKAENLKEATNTERLSLKKSSTISINFTFKVQPTRKILNATNLAKSYGDLNVLKSVDLEIIRGDRVVIIGRNGVGKSTLLKILAGVLKQDSGEFEWGDTVDFGYYSQEFEGLNYEETIMENLKHDARLGGLPEQYLRQLLGNFRFSGEKINQKVRSLSGGEKTRLALTRILAGGYNTLILDEPTTYLDPQSQVILLDALKKYTGTLILVSHLPDFVGELNANKLLLMPEEKTVLYNEKYLDLVGIS